MRPKTKNEKEVTRLAAHIPALTDAQQRWIERNAVPAIAYQFRKIDYKELVELPTLWAWCSNCGHEFMDGNAKRCPHCGAKFTKHEYKPTTKVSKGKWYTTIITTCGGWQVCRHFLVEHHSRKGCGSRHDANEAVQIWTNAKGEQVINARSCRPMVMYSDLWIFSQPMSIKHRRPYCYKYDINSHAIKVCSILPILRRNGFDGDTHDIAPADLFRIILTDNFAETLFKCHQWALVRMLAYDRAINRDVAKICMRHGYIVKDAIMWRDYIEMCEELGMDIHNPQVCCPADLKAAHDRMQRRLERKHKREEIERQRKEMADAEKRYAVNKARYLGIIIKGKGITLCPLQNVAAFYDEWKAMRHCVFSGKYYDKEESLILSATDDAGKRMETIEFDLNKGKVIQCQGVCNGITEHHDEIVELCNNNAKRILNHV